mmetsp:Transcript_56633/g.94274  ORF Transcript_56633/g.94274 Transcript_56633/m.94274 type:complete len:179 (+) Transcript_56633:79-615(+)
MSEPFIGEIRSFGGNYCPAGWLSTSGNWDGTPTTLPIDYSNSYFSLYALLVDRYGGDGITTFGLPVINIVDDGSNSIETCIAFDGLWPQRSSAEDQSDLKELVHGGTIYTNSWEAKQPFAYSQLSAMVTVFCLLQLLFMAVLFVGRKVWLCSVGKSKNASDSKNQNVTETQPLLCNKI